LVARFVRDEEVAGSNPVTPTWAKSGNAQNIFGIVKQEGPGWPKCHPGLSFSD
jgi:hypothetical protein